MKLNIEGLNKAKLVKALYDNALPTEKTKDDEEITLKTIKRFLDKDRKINVINGKNIKVDTGRSKLSSGVYDKFNGEFAAAKAIHQLKCNYDYVPLYGMTLEKTIDELSKYNENDDYVYTIFNGHYIYSDSLDIESIVKSFYNMDLDIFNHSKKSKEINEVEKSELIWLKKRYSIIDYYYALGKGLIPDNLLDSWKEDLCNYIGESLYGEEINTFLYMLENDLTDPFEVVKPLQNVALILKMQDKYGRKK